MTDKLSIETATRLMAHQMRKADPRKEMPRWFDVPIWLLFWAFLLCLWVVTP